MSQVYFEKAGRMEYGTVQNMIKIVYNVLSPYIQDYKIPELYNDKKDFGDIDFFCLLKKGITFDKEEIINIFKKNGILIEDIYRNDLEYTMLIKYNNSYYHIDLHPIIAENSDFFYNTYFPYYKKPFFGYYFGTFIKQFGIKYSSKGVFFFSKHKENGYNDVYIKITDNLYDIIDFFIKNYRIETKISQEDIIKKLENISNMNDLISFLENFSLFSFYFFNKEVINYKARRKINQYKINNEVYNKIINNAIDNFSLYFSGYSVDDLKNKILEQLLYTFPGFKDNYILEMNKLYNKDVYKQMKNELYQYVWGEDFGKGIEKITKGDNVELKEIFFDIVRGLQVELDFYTKNNKQKFENNSSFEKYFNDLKKYSKNLFIWGA